MNNTLNHEFKVLNKIGEGATSEVYVCEFPNLKKEFAIKILKDNPSYNHYFENEISVLKKINVNQITNLILYGNAKFIWDNEKISDNNFMILDLAKKGELLNYIIKPKKGFSESQTRFLFNEILKGIKIIHQNNITHLDLKTENIMIDENYNLKISDFGFSFEHSDQNLINIFQGSEKYKSPEIILKKNFDGFKADIFSLGIILFVLLTGNFPFKSARKFDICYMNIIRNKNENFWDLLKKKIFDDKEENLPSQEFRDLFIKMIQFEPNNRISVNDIFNHPWMKGTFPSKDEIIEEFKIREKTFSNYNFNDNICSLIKQNYQGNIMN